MKITKTFHFRDFFFEHFDDFDHDGYVLLEGLSMSVNYQ
jgi:hypothetical protein